MGDRHSRALHRTVTRQQAIDVILTPAKDISRVPVASKRILLRADLNVPVDKSGNITDDTRITAVLPTIKELSKRGARILIVSHFGRPKPGEQTVEEMKAKYSLAPVAKELAEKLGDIFVGLAPDTVGPEVEELASKLQDGQVSGACEPFAEEEYLLSTCQVA
jgi:phosphoglycerate kinase